ncbi:hypothetical protein D9M68_926940 [compost metagenome]
MRMILRIQSTPKTIETRAAPTMFSPIGSSHRTFMNPGLTTRISPAVQKGSRPSTHADSLPSADSTRILSNSFSRSRTMVPMVSRISARLPPLSRWISTAMTK